MCKDCKTYPAAFDTSYGMDPIAEQATEQPSDLQLVAANVVTPEQLEGILSDSSDGADVLLYPEGAIKLEGKYYTFGSSDRAKAALTEFVEDHLERVAEPEPENAGQSASDFPMTVADPAGIYGPAQTDDMHDTATVENTTLLIQDLERQLGTLSAENLALRQEVHDTREELDRVSKLKSGVYANAQRFLKERNLAVDACVALRNLNSEQEARAKEFAVFALNNLRKLVMSLEVSKGRTNYYQQKSDKLQATIDYMKRPFYERWAISLRGRAS